MVTTARAGVSKYDDMMTDDSRRSRTGIHVLALCFVHLLGCEDTASDAFCNDFEHSTPALRASFDEALSALDEAYTMPVGLPARAGACRRAAAALPVERIRALEGAAHRAPTSSSRATVDLGSGTLSLQRRSLLASCDANDDAMNAQQSALVRLEAALANTWASAERRCFP